MPRLDRIDHVGARHHVMNRGARRSTIFMDAECCARFLDLLGELPARYGMAVHAYALMPNHFHLLLESRAARLSVAMAYLQSRYAYWLNRRFEWDGPLLRGRFRNRVVEDPDYWRYLFAYLHLNPVRGHLAPTADMSDWTSHTVYVGLESRPAWLTSGEFRKCFASVEEYRDYVHQVHIGRQEPPPGFDPDEVWEGPATGIVRLHLSAPDGTAGIVPTTGPMPHTEQLEVLLGELRGALGLSREELLGSRRGRRGNRARWVAAWWMTRWGRLPGRVVATAMGIKPSGVSQMAAKARSQRHDDVDLDAWMTALENLVYPR